MSNFRCRKEVQDIFDKYKESNIARRLTRTDAIKMMQEEFGLTEDQADKIFDTFDQDKNGIMSIWEFQALYITVGDG
jgi:Ca2+-binding EF-hand superfamily protein